MNSSKSEYFKGYYGRNSEVIRKRSHDWYHGNSDRAVTQRAKYYQENRDEILVKAKKYNEDPEHKAYHKKVSRRSHLKNFFNWTTEMFDDMFAKQNHSCAICGSAESGGRGWHVDHDHSCCPGRKSCGKCIRGILCCTCNTAIGLMKDRIDILFSAGIYLGII